MTLSHHLPLAILMTIKTMMLHLTDATSDKSNEKDESYHDKEPRDIGKEVALIVFFEFCEQ